MPIYFGLAILSKTQFEREPPTPIHVTNAKQIGLSAYTELGG